VHKDATNQVSWQVSDTTIASVSSTGLLSIRASGEGDVTATYQTVTGRAHFLAPTPRPTFVMNWSRTLSFPDHHNGFIKYLDYVNQSFEGAATCMGRGGWFWQQLSGLRELARPGWIHVHAIDWRRPGVKWSLSGGVYTPQLVRDIRRSA
jgi:hypothetical protein